MIATLSGSDPPPWWFLVLFALALVIAFIQRHDDD
jgi:MYXO-CTERM domain-containing protein